MFAARDLSEGVSEIERLLGITATVGGRHPTWGTRNALAALGPASYLEIIAPDHDQSSISGVRPSDWTIFIAHAWLRGQPTHRICKRYVRSQLGTAYRSATFFSAADSDPTVRYFSGR